VIVSAGELHSRHGVVVAPDPRAAAAGQTMLREGGNAFDAAVAAAFAIGVVEPFMSGIGGSGWVTARFADTGRVLTIDGSAKSPAAASPELFPLAGGADGGLYGWPRVVDDANVMGPRSVAVPGNVAALAAAAEHGRLGLAACLQPAIELAARGTQVNWFATSCIVAEMRNLRRDPGALALYFRDGVPIVSDVTGPEGTLVQPALAETLGRIARQGPAEIYGGESGRSFARFLQAGGGILTAEDMAGYAPVIEENAVGWQFEGFRLHGPLRTGVGTVVQMLRLLEAHRRADPGIDPRLAWALSSDAAIAERLTRMTAAPDGGTDWATLLSPEHADRLVAEPIPAVGAGRPGCTDHLTATDADGNVVSLTQTVLDLFGARVVDPETGVLFNDGMMYFDPRPEAVNAVRPSTYGMSATAPIVVEHAGGVTGLGASGGRRIMSAVAQITERVVAGASVGAAIDAPRLHAEKGTVTLDVRDADALGLLERRFAVEVREEQPTTWHFARPNGITVSPDGMQSAGADPHKPYGMLAAG